MDIEIELSADVLVPRAETEILGERAVDVLRERPGNSLVVDMCCGSGNLALGIANRVASARVLAADLTDASVVLARRNTQRLGLADRVTIRQGDLFAALDADDLQDKVDLVVCNPPYISTARLDGRSAGLLLKEPREAFDGGPYGISILKRLIRDALLYLKPGGWLIFEVGDRQERQARTLIARAAAYDGLVFDQEAPGKPFVVSARRSARPPVSGQFKDPPR